MWNLQSKTMEQITISRKEYEFFQSLMKDTAATAKAINTLSEALEPVIDICANSGSKSVLTMVPKLLPSVQKIIPTISNELQGKLVPFSRKYLKLNELVSDER